MAAICPTVTAYDRKTFAEQVAKLTPFAQRIHLDFMERSFTGVDSPKPNEVMAPAGVAFDIHLMYKQPLDYIEAVTALRPGLVIVHAEAEGNFITFADAMHRAGIKAGVALLQKTPVGIIRPALEAIDHVLIFSGKLGHHGGLADLALLDKVKEIRQVKPAVEIGWDGGVNASVVKELSAAGVDVLNVGGAIQESSDPGAAYGKLKALAES